MKYLFVVLSILCFIACKPSLPKLVDVGIADMPDVKPGPVPSPAPAGLSWKIGLVTQEYSGVVCLQTENPDLAPNAVLTIIEWPYQIPQKIRLATVKDRLETSCIYGEPDIEEKSPKTYYSLQLAGKDDSGLADIGLAIAILNVDEPVRLTNGLANIDLDGDGKAEYFRQCSSFEGQHSTVWTGKPPKGKVIWHNYHHLQYGTNPTCTKNESEGFEE